MALLGRMLIPFPAPQLHQLPMCDYFSGLFGNTFKDRVSTTSPRAEVLQSLQKAELLLLAAHTTDSKQLLQSTADLLYLGLGCEGCFELSAGLFSLHTLLQSFFAEHIFCCSEHSCYFSLGPFQLNHTTLEAW